jgi:hypothetical protein
VRVCQEEIFEEGSRVQTSRLVETKKKRLGEEAKTRAELGLQADASNEDLEKRKNDLAAGKRKPETLTKCAYLTDAEGDWENFCCYVENSEVLEWDNEQTKRRLKFKDEDGHKNTMLVFGGNSQDNSSSRTRILNMLKAKDKGLKWLSVGNTEPETGRDLKHEKLAEKLSSKTIAGKGKMPSWMAIPNQAPRVAEFTKEEWEDFDIKDLCADHFIKSGDSYFRPDFDTLKDKDKPIVGGDIRITKLLLDLKEGNKDRVVLIIGYRDANKLRLAWELQDDFSNLAKDIEEEENTGQTCYHTRIHTHTHI